MICHTIFLCYRHYKSSTSITNLTAYVQILFPINQGQELLTPVMACVPGIDAYINYPTGNVERANSHA